jgi:hypothetical protein
VGYKLQASATANGLQLLLEREASLRRDKRAIEEAAMRHAAPAACIDARGSASEPTRPFRRWRATTRCLAAGKPCAEMGPRRLLNPVAVAGMLGQYRDDFGTFPAQRG